jgi:hypothetical protein
MRATGDGGYAWLSGFWLDSVRRRQPRDGRNAAILIRVSMKGQCKWGFDGHTVSVTRAVPRITFFRSRPNGILCEVQFSVMWGGDTGGRHLGSSSGLLGGRGIGVEFVDVAACLFCFLNKLLLLSLDLLRIGVRPRRGGIGASHGAATTLSGGPAARGGVLTLGMCLGCVSVTSRCVRGELRADGLEFGAASRAVPELSGGRCGNERPARQGKTAGGGGLEGAERCVSECA